MPINPKYLEKLKAGLTYHAYNRTNNRESLFRDENDQYFFLEKLNFFLGDFVDIHAYCLLGNHFHLLFTIKESQKIFRRLKRKMKYELSKSQLIFMSDYQDDRAISRMLTSQFSRLFITYSVTFNKGYGRNGNLFQRPFKRIIVQDDFYFKQLVLYIHQNPVKHKITLDYESYPWSSYLFYMGPDKGIISKTKTITLFGGLREFKKQHRLKIDFTEIYEFLLENETRRKRTGIS